MSEYSNVEKPFLEKLDALGWQVIDHGAKGIPQNPVTSLRTSFKEVTLERVFKQAIANINKTDTGEAWLTEKQLDDLYTDLLDLNAANLHEANKAIFELLTKNTTVSVNELTGEVDPIVRLIDFKQWDNNSFIAINQFRIDTPGGARSSIIPDIVLFVNGLPFVVVECKATDVSEPLSEAERQIRRYSNRRDDDFGVKEGEERLFHFNVFSILTHGEEARFGSISADFDYYYNWKDIFPETYKTLAVHQDNEQTQAVLIHGLLNKEILLDVLRHFTLFMEVKAGVEVKLICRYQQYRAVGKILARLRSGTTANERSGVVWHTQGSGKSLTMVFLVRKLRSQDDLKDYKVIMVNDRTDLEKQLTLTAKLTGEKVHVVASRNQLRPKLSTDSADLTMVMVHKCLGENIHQSKALMKIYEERGEVPQFKPFEQVNSSDRIILLIDEAHRTQGGEMGDNLFAAFPHATKIAFTGTPLLTQRHTRKTHERFGSFIDEYKIKQSVRDKATLDILYIGRTSQDQITNSEGFRVAFEDAFKKQSEAERLEIQRRYGTMQAYLENMDRLRKIAEDIVEHYTTEILVNGFKAQVVASSVRAAARYENLIKEALQKKISREQAKPDAERDDEWIKQMQFLEVCTVVTKQDNNEDGYVSAARKKAKELKAVDSFKLDFDFDKPESGVGILCVCDRLLTGFDAPVEQAMYLDKNQREHDLLQTIARVNRRKGQTKKHGIVVDYFGVANHLKEALAIYSDDEEILKEFLEFFRDINKEIPALEARYQRLLQLFGDQGIKEIDDFVNQRMSDKAAEFDVAERCVDLAEGIPFRAQFDTYIQAFFDSLDLLFNVEQAKDFYIPAKRFAYLMMRIRNRYSDETLDLKFAGAKVRKLIDVYLQSQGIDSKIPPVSLLSDEFPKQLEKLASSKSKASEMAHAVRRHIKVNLDKDPELYTQFNERLKAILERFQNNWDLIVEELHILREEMNKGRKTGEDGLTTVQQPFYGLLTLIVFAEQTISDDTKAKLKALTVQVVTELQQRMAITRFWRRDSEIRALRAEIDNLLHFSGIAEIVCQHERLTHEILALAKKRHFDLTGNTEN
ncbi:MAG: HsdR family type I site-specific deoxyribonuclease [Methylobacter sp.]|nr:HsdR family type I site-specific deoxyribonuclease [Methylobacter sp.]